VQVLFERAVIATCWADCVDLGNATFPAMFADCWNLEGWKHPENPYVWPLLETPGVRAGVWRHGSGGFGEGVNGWLDPDETWLLADGAMPANVPVNMRPAVICRCGSPRRCWPAPASSPPCRRAPQRFARSIGRGRLGAPTEFGYKAQVLDNTDGGSVLVYGPAGTGKSVLLDSIVAGTGHRVRRPPPPARAAAPGTLDRCRPRRGQPQPGPGSPRLARGQRRPSRTASARRPSRARPGPHRRRPGRQAAPPRRPESRVGHSAPPSSDILRQSMRPLPAPVIRELPEMPADDPVRPAPQQKPA
jgi:hypothetical protein